MTDFVKFSRGKKIATFGALLLILLFPLFLFFIASVYRSNIQKSEYAPDQVIIKYSSEYAPDTLQDETKKKKLAEVLIQAGVISQEKIFDTQEEPLKTYYLLHLKPGSDVVRIREYLNTHKEIGISQPNYAAHAQVVPNDSLYQQYLWGMKNIQMEQAWDITTGENSPIVAIVDTGVDYNHVDLPKDIIKGFDYINNDNDPMDDQGHGTHLAGTLGAIANNSTGVVGVNWHPKIMAVKVLDNQGRGFSDKIAEGVKYAVDNGARVLNLSLTADSSILCSQDTDPFWRDAVKYAIDHNVVVVAAAGNNSHEATHAPASCDGAISVGAIDINNARASFSNYGARVDVAAPGVNVLSTRATNCSASWCNSSIVDTNYVAINGTSMATPHVAGVASLLLAMHPNMTTAQVRDCIKNSGDTITTDRPLGKRLNAVKALTTCNQSVPTATPTPANVSPTAAIPTPTTPPVGGTGVSVYFANQPKNTTPILNKVFTPSTPGTMDLYVQTGGNNLNGFDITLTTTGGVTITKIDEGPDAAKFATAVYNDLSNGGHTIRYGKISTDLNATITGVLHIGVVTFGVPASGTGTIVFSNVLITSPDSKTALPNTKFDADYTVGSGTISPTVIPSSTPKPTSTPIPTTPPIGGNGVLLYLSDTNSPVTTYAFTPNTTTPLKLYVDVGSNNINGFNMTVTTTGALKIAKIDEGPDAAKFGTKVYNDLSADGMSIKYSKVSIDTTKTISGLLYIGDVSFVAPATGAGTIDFSKVTVSSPDASTGLPFTKFAVNYTIGASQVSPTLPAGTPLPTSAITPQPCLMVSDKKIKAGKPLKLTLAQCNTPTPVQPTIGIPTPTSKPSFPFGVPPVKVIFPGWMEKFMIPLPPFIWPIIFEFDHTAPDPFAPPFPFSVPNPFAPPFPFGN